MASDSSSSSEINISEETNFSTSCTSISPTINLSLQTFCIATLRTQNHYVTYLAVQNNLLYAASGNRIEVFDLITQAHIDTFNPCYRSSGCIKSIAFDNNKVLTAHQDSKIRVWCSSRPSNRHHLVSTLPTVNDQLHRFILPKNYVRIRRHKKALWVKHNDAVSGIAVNGGSVYSVSWDKSLKIWRTSDYKCMESVAAHDDAVNAVAVSTDATVYTASADGKIRVWERNYSKGPDLGRHGLVATLERGETTVNAIVLSRDGSVLFSGGSDGIIVVWEREDSAHYMVVSHVLGGHEGAVLCLISFEHLHHQTSGGTNLFASGSADRTVRIWGPCYESSYRGTRGSGYCCFAVLEGHQKPVRALVAVSEGGLHGGVLVCSGGLDGQIRIWQMKVSCPLQIIKINSLGEHSINNLKLKS